MKRFVALVVLSVVLVVTAFAQGKGSWNGKLSLPGADLTLVFHLEEDGTATLDVPDQGAKDIPVTVSWSETGGLTMKVPAIAAEFKGVLMGRKIIGEFTQNGMTFPMTLNPGVPELRRPQTPTPPFPYKTEEVSFANGDVVLAGTLTLPAKCSKNTPVLVMVTGSGLQNRDEELFGHKPFAVIADAFARAGIATLRYDDRGFGQSTGDTASGTTEDFKDDALAGVRMLRKRFDKVGVLGHSEGGTIALMLAAEGEADFVISLAGMVVSGAETLLAQNSAALVSAGLPEDEVAEFVRLLRSTFSAIADGTALPSPDQYKVSEALRQNWAAAVRQLDTPYFRCFLRLDVSQSLGVIKCPVMALNGVKDTQVDCERNLGALRKGLPAGVRSFVKAEDGLNHLFQHCGTGAVTEYKEIEETFSQDVLKEMIAWIQEMA